MEPATTVAIVQGGLQIYQALNSKGSGIGGLLAAQTEMLRQIQKQITVIGEVTLEIYKDVNWIKDKLLTVPSETAREIYSLGGKASIIQAGEILYELTLDIDNVGRDSAVSGIKDRAEKIISELQTNRSALISEKQIGSIPLVSALWDIEITLLLSCVSFDASRILSANNIYRGWFNSCIIELIEPEIDRRNKKINDFNTSIKNNAKYVNYKCRGNIVRTECHPSRFVGGLLCSYSWTDYTWSSSPALVSDIWVKLLESGKQMIANGAPINSVIEIKTYKWRFETKEGDAQAPVYHDIAPRLYSELNSCFLEPNVFVEQEDTRTKEAEIQIEYLCLYGNLWLLAHKTINTIEKIEKEIEKWQP